MMRSLSDSWASLFLLLAIFGATVLGGPTKSTSPGLLRRTSEQIYNYKIDYTDLKLSVRVNTSAPLALVELNDFFDKAYRDIQSKHSDLSQQVGESWQFTNAASGLDTIFTIRDSGLYSRALTWRDTIDILKNGFESIIKDITSTGGKLGEMRYEVRGPTGGRFRSILAYGNVKRASTSTVVSS